MTHGLVIGKFYPLHGGHRLLLETAAAECDRLTVVAMASSVESIPLADRVAWLRELLAAHDHVRVVGQQDDLPMDLASEQVWRDHVALMQAAVARAAVADRVPEAAGIDVVFTSESYGPELARRFGARHVAVDPPRRQVPVSATAVRADPEHCWEALTPPARRSLALRVVVLGAESTGTTTVSRLLAERLRARGGAHGLTGWVREVGRDWTVDMLRSGAAHALRIGEPAPTIDDLLWLEEDFLAIAAQQQAEEDAAAAAGGPVLVCDTDAFTTGVWFTRYLGGRLPALDRAGGALYLLTDDAGVPFEQDGIRDGEHLRSWMTQEFADRLDEAGAPWLRLTGPLAERVDATERAVDELLARGWQLADPVTADSPQTRESSGATTET